MWSGESQTWDVDSAYKMMDEVISAVIEDLQKNKMIPVKTAE